MFLLCLFQSWSAFSLGASKLSGKVAEVGWKFSEIATQKATEVSGVVSEKVSQLKSCFSRIVFIILVLLV